ncbi:MAG: hypothetical protein JWQ59_475, partial [Cryobacterium sp.]|nr:hypothetical protein [Cryobacterium sp.]
IDRESQIFPSNARHFCALLRRHTTSALPTVAIVTGAIAAVTAKRSGRDTPI